jgi:D-ribose pyranase
MKKGVLLNADISALISRLGHTDQVVIADAGLPIPAATLRIDLALTQGVPTFLQIVDVVTSEMQVEKAILAQY